MPRRKKTESGIPRREFLKTSGYSVGAMGAITSETAFAQRERGARRRAGTRPSHVYNGEYSGPHLSRVAFPLGGIGAGMLCLEGTGALSHVSFRNKPEVFNEPMVFAAVAVKEANWTARVLEGPVPP